MKDFLIKIGNFFVSLYDTFKLNYQIILIFIIIGIILFFVLHLIWERNEKKIHYRYRK